MTKILVAYASRCGSTGEVAQDIGQMLCEAGAQVDVRPAKDVSDLSPYQAVVVGSAIRIGRWLPEAIKWVEAHQDALSQVPVAFFAVCMALAEETEENQHTAESYLDPVRELVRPAQEALFAGVMDYKKLPILQRFMIKLMGIAEGDFRDWDAIRAWAADLYPTLVKA